MGVSPEGDTGKTWLTALPVVLAERAGQRGRAAGLGRVMEILLEANMAGESSKSGFSPQELRERLGELASLEHIRIRGMMCIPERGRGGYWFQKAGELFQALKDARVPGTRLDWLSMGMSADYGQAILCGANMVRIGSALFGERG